VALPKQDLLRPPAALPVLASLCEQLNVDYTVNDLNLWLYKNISIETWNKINDNWSSVDPFANRHQPYYQTFLEQLNKFVDHLLDQQVELIAISVFSDVSAHCAVEFIQNLNRRPERRTLSISIGGSGIRATLPVFDNRDLCVSLLDQGLIDTYIFGEGEVAFSKILLKEFDYPGINNYDATQLDNLNQFPFPSYRKINPWDYNYIELPEITITGSRGCVRNCTYCDVARYWPKFRYRDGNYIADELYYYYKTYGIKKFEFSDSLINGSLKQFRLMNQRLLELKDTDPDFEISYKGQYICRAIGQNTEADYKNMKQAGCDFLYVGVESFSDHVRFDMDKKFKNVDLEWHLKMCGRYGIKNSFLMLVGYPTETLEDHQQNLALLKQYQHYAQAGIISMIVFGYTASILEDTPLFHLQEKLNIVPEYDDVDSFVHSNWVSLDNPTLTLVERIRRWVELVELASELGYALPRNQHYISRFIELLKSIKSKKKFFKISQQKT
jgi:radical SAM superfamily enzyme YgiQ (UPF0313 family)